jgi:steroid 5-alpha reductase family enzyme
MIFIVSLLAGLYSTATILTLLKYHMFGWVMGSFVLCGLAAGLLMTIVFSVAKRIKRYDLIDAAWGWSFMVIAATSFLLQPGIKWEFDTQLLVTLFVFIWGGRLSLHIIKRIRSTDSEDPRYVEIRKKWRGNLALNIYIRMYITQAVLALLISLPVIHINLFADSGWSPWLFVGGFIWVAGFIIESISDSQLRQFITTPVNKGKLMTQGLWRYSRHPNYFGELAMWWGIGIICLSTPFGWVGIAGPVLITYLIYFVSGIPIHEKRSEGRPGWESYKHRTSILIPLPPRR